MYGRSYPSLREVKVDLILVETTMRVGEIDFDVVADVHGELCQGDHVETSVDGFSAFHAGLPHTGENEVENDDVIKNIGRQLDQYCREYAVTKRFSF